MPAPNQRDPVDWEAVADAFYAGDPDVVIFDTLPPGPDVFQGSFVGLAFGAAGDSTYEAVYLRPGGGGGEPRPAAGGDAVGVRARRQPLAARVVRLPAGRRPGQGAGRGAARRPRRGDARAPHGGCRRQVRRTTRDGPG